ncbi:hypothetical protein [Pseudomonas azotoformans]|uniref:hypothetical protein n=1 Tax=Pseudomonas azotoformans TaxID=47878 RepID=UPI00098FE78D|nr:hypothetical protein [Pseudomonas azotoformans]AQT94255.1 hypothetical protein B1R45_13580 [Pseudomonas azotoformans]UMY52032.1 hypothetical protein MLC69_13525 [Pseudomonas azotoformans]
MIVGAEKSHSGGRRLTTPLGDIDNPPQWVNIAMGGDGSVGRAKHSQSSILDQSRLLRASVARDNAKKQDDTATMSEINREELDAKLSAVEARMDRRIADFQGDMRQAVSDFRLEIQPIKGMKANIWSATAVMIATIVAVVSLSFTAFDSGRETSVLVQEAKQQSIETRKLLEQIQAQQKNTYAPTQAPTLPQAQPPQSNSGS